MVLLCFVLDLRSLSPPLLDDLKQALLHLGNFYAISSCRRDRIGLCYLLFDRIISSRQLNIAYSPRANFSLQDFHYAVNRLPADAFFPYIEETSSISSQDLKVSSVLSDDVLYSWGDEDIVRKKVVFITSCLDGIGIIDSVTRESLNDAADKCVSVEFVLLEQKSSHLHHLSEDINDFVKHICDLENCCFHSYLPDSRTLNWMVKQWLRELKDDVEESLQARFIFDSNFLGSLNSITCKLSLAASQIIDNFDPCQTCRCHGISIDGVVVNRTKELSTCPITGYNLGALDFIENAVKVGKHTILFPPSFRSCQKLQQVSLPVKLNVIERTRLASLSEGVIVGPSYFVTPSNCHEIETASDETDKSELNSQFFRGLCCALNSLDEGLVCSSNCNIETMNETAFLCYYLLQPSEDGPMLLRRLVGSEEVLPCLDFNQSSDSPVTKEIVDSIQASLLKMYMMEKSQCKRTLGHLDHTVQMGLSDYNPLVHERGFHQKLNLLVKESVHFWSIPPKATTTEPYSTQLNSPERNGRPDSAATFTLNENIAPEMNVQPDSAVSFTFNENKASSGDDKTASCIAEEWEQLIVNEPPKIHSPNTHPKPISELPVLCPYSRSIKNVDENTSRILERLELPKQMKPKVVVSPIIKTSLTTNAGTHTKRPLFPVQTNYGTDHGVTMSQPMKPTFQRIKRKQR